MAAEFLRSHGIDVDAEMARIQHQSTNDAPSPSASLPTRAVRLISNVSLPRSQPGTRWDVSIAGGRISTVTQHDSQHSQSEAGKVIHGQGALLAPSLCHPHIHIDKAYLLSHPKYSDLRIESGDFIEAMSLTSKAKAQFEEEDLLQRGQRVIDESVEAGVTHMRAFVEVDIGVGSKCLEAGIALKQKAETEGKCKVQLCAFAQLPLFSDASAAGEQDKDANVIRKLMELAATKQEVDVIGSTPYVEGNSDSMKRNVDWMIDLSLKHSKHLDFHLDYNLDVEKEPMVWYVIERLKAEKWKSRAPNKTVVLGHCTRLTLFTPEQWKGIKREIGDLPISFVGLPTSDLFMMRTPERVRGTLNVPELIKDHNLNACLGINNIGNAFTPQGTCDPLTLACTGVGVYQAGTERDVEILYECVSTRAARAIGMGVREDLTLAEGDQANLLLFGTETHEWRTRRSVPEAVYLYDHCRGRKALLQGVQTND